MLLVILAPLLAWLLCVLFMLALCRAAARPTPRPPGHLVKPA